MNFGQQFGFIGAWKAEHLRPMDLIPSFFHGVTKRLGDMGLLHCYKMNNGITNIGRNSVLDVYFRNQTQLPNWYVGLIQDGGYTGLAAGDTMASHAGWTEFTGYDEATRVAWSPGAASSQSITNATAMTFTINTGDTLKGIFVNSVSTKSGTTGTLWSTALFSSDPVVESSDQFKLTYTLND